MKFWLGLAGGLSVAAAGAVLTMEGSSPDGSPAPAALLPSATPAEVTEADRAGVPRQMQARAILARQASEPPRAPAKPAAPVPDPRATKEAGFRAEARVRQAESEAAEGRRRLEQAEARANDLSQAAAAARDQLAAARAEVEALRAAQDRDSARALTAEEARRVAEGAADGHRQALDAERARAEHLAGALSEAQGRVAALEGAVEAARTALQAQAASAARERAMMRAGLRRLAVALRAAQVARSEAAARAVEVAGERDRAEQGRLAAERAGAEARGRLDRLRNDTGHAAGTRPPEGRGSDPSLVLRTRPGAAPASAAALDEERLMARVAVLLGRGDISGARLFLTLGVRNGSARATALLAETYDPDRLAALRVRGMRGDPERASALYRQAQKDRGQEDQDQASQAVENQEPEGMPAGLAARGPATWTNPVRQAGLPGPVLGGALAPAVPSLAAPWGGE